MRSFIRGLRGIVLGAALLSGTGAYAADPECTYQHKPMPVNNDQVVYWKANAGIASGWKGRGNVEGVVTQVLPDRNGHGHFLIELGSNAANLLEVVYNQDFGDIPPVHIGMRVHACGDFIKSNQQNGPYPPSPAGAIIHWIHQSPDPMRHENGYVVLDGVLYGNGPDRKAGRSND